MSGSSYVVLASMFGSNMTVRLKALGSDMIVHAFH
jgi:hypothetical protein